MRWRSSAALGLATLLCWLYGLHLYSAANRPLHAPAGPHESASSTTSSPSTAGSPSSARTISRGAPPLSDSNDGLLTFIHASDIHVSKYVPKGGLIHFLHFLHTAVPLISPRLVAVTGDLTDGKDQQRLTSLQQLDEWKAYRRALESSAVRTRFNGSFYRDQRGNHDCFNVFSANSADNYFNAYSAAGSVDGYHLQIEEPFGTYSFVASDGCPRHGFARPLNFFGYLDAQGMELLESRLARASASSNHTFLLNHYPVSTMLYGRYNRTFADLVRGVSVFLCGHLHQLAAGVGAQLQAYKAHDGYWELEIGDMKEHAIYRVYAVDHDLISFVDVTLPVGAIMPMPNPQLLDVTVTEPIPHPPVVLVTNPKDARYLLPNHEPLHIMRSSKFIRALETKNEHGDVLKTPLWVAPWDPAQYDDARLHELEVTAVDEAGKATTVRIPFHFSDDLVALDNDSRGGWIMRQNFPDIFRVSGITSYLLVTVFMLLIPRFYFASLSDSRAWVAARTLKHHKDEARLRHLWAAFTRGDIVNPFTLVKLLLALIAARTRFLVSTQFTAQVYFASIGWLFWPAYFFAIALVVLPLFTGLLIPSAGPMGVGSVYAYGIYIAGEWAPLLDSWTYALSSIISLGLLLVYLPLAAAPHSLFYSPYTARGLPWYRSLPARLSVAVFCVLYLGLPTLMTVYTYGPASVVFGYGRSWMFIAACAALYVLDWRPDVGLLSSSYAQVPSPPSSARLDDDDNE
ncbi:hypothetical protein H4R26_003128 [Coemansia thaxteri]|uniref:Calcineurin-like phosphoesterase domain-containing protein n=1 Tax=Coemansia thaxteri TaxID=2663907 RepID=A0A9W8EIU9_9FUNG|nr:hypothetical protein H4R26_003128 [Coemansia thaxteri]KAJ2479933.1 hypothetical protein EV174_003878 [Coemansia sp. RSA 2320]